MKLTLAVILVAISAGLASAQSGLYGTKTYGTGSNPSSHQVSPYVN